MALILADRVRETSTTTGTGALTLAGAVVGYQTFSSAIGNTNTTYYAISNPGVAEWEVGIGTYATSGNTLTRTTIIKSSNSNNAVNFSAGTKDVFVTYPATKSVYLDASGNASALGTPASGTVTNLTGTASININGTVGATTQNAGLFTSVAFPIAAVAPASMGIFNSAGTTLTAIGGSTGIFFNNAANNVTNLAILNAGNVGIGTTTPSSFNGLNCKLAVNGGPVGLANTNAASQYIWLASHFSGVASGLYTDSDAFPMLGTTTAHPYKFMTSATERMRIDSSGNVGIGTGATAPQGKFQVLNEGSLATDTDSNTTNTIIAGNNKTATTNQGNLFIYSNSTATDGFGGSICFGGLYSGTTVAAFGRIAGVRSGGSFNGALVFSARDTSGNMPEAMRISSAGNVGISNQTPVGKLDITQATTNTSAIIVAHSGAGGGSNTNYGAQINVTGASNTNTGVYSNCYGATNNYGVRIINPPASATSWALYSDATAQSYFAGSVGIGTNAPRFNLSIGALTATSTATPDTIDLGGTYSSTAGSNIKLRLLWDNSVTYGLGVSTAQLDYVVPSASHVFWTNGTEKMRITSAGRVGIGTGATVNYALEVSTDSAGKPGVGGLWTVVSDERIKSDIVPANLDRCYEIVKSVPLKHFGFAPGVYTDDQIQDKHNLGWIAQDVQKVFKNAVSVKPFTLKTDIPDGIEEYEEQDFTLEVVEKTETSIQVINGKAVQVSKVVTSENKVFLFDTVDVVDEAGAAVLEEYEVTPAVSAVAATDGIEAVEATDETEAVEAVNAVDAVEAIPAVMGTRPVTYQMPRMITKTRPKVRHDVIEDCLDLNGAQMLAALYGAVQALMEKVEVLETKLATLEVA